MPNSDPQDKLVYPIHKLMIDSFNLAIVERVQLDHGWTGLKYVPDSLSCVFPTKALDHHHGENISTSE